jgi:hypothetical protein
MLTFLSINPDPRAHTAASESSKTAMEVEEEEEAERTQGAFRTKGTMLFSFTFFAFGSWKRAFPPLPRTRYTSCVFIDAVPCVEL